MSGIWNRKEVRREELRGDLRAIVYAWLTGLNETLGEWEQPDDLASRLLRYAVVSGITFAAFFIPVPLAFWVVGFGIFISIIGLGFSSPKKKGASGDKCQGSDISRCR